MRSLKRCRRSGSAEDGTDVNWIGERSDQKETSYVTIRERFDVRFQRLFHALIDGLFDENEREVVKAAYCAGTVVGLYGSNSAIAEGVRLGNEKVYAAGAMLEGHQSLLGNFFGIGVVVGEAARSMNEMVVID